MMRQVSHTYTIDANKQQVMVQERNCHQGSSESKVSCAAFVDHVQRSCTTAGLPNLGPKPKAPFKIKSHTCTLSRHGLAMQVTLQHSAVCFNAGADVHSKLDR